jgi:hypothetical protein
MCTVSNVGNGFGRDYWPGKYDFIKRDEQNIFQTIPSGVTRQEFDKLRAEVEALRKLLEAAKQFDKETGQPDCEMDEKVAAIKRIAEIAGVDLGAIFGK